LFPSDPEVLDLVHILGLTETMPAATAPTVWMDRYQSLETGPQNHGAGAFKNETLRQVEALLPLQMESSVETGCGKSTILFSNLASKHTVFALDDRQHGDQSSVRFFLDCPLSRPDRVEFIFGPTQRTLPLFAGHVPYDLIMLDGPHGYPFPELEYLFLYPHLKKGGILILDDVHGPTIGRLADFIAEDEMFECIGLVEATALFRRTEAPTFDPCGDGWWAQRYNRRRVSPGRTACYLLDGPVVETFTARKLDLHLNPPPQPT
jgi:hypothetical protein